MRGFLIKSAFFLLPLVLGGGLLEVFILVQPNSFNYKSIYLKKNKDIKVLFLGSSHTQNGINPAYLTTKSANLAYGSQDYKLDSALLFTLAKQLSQLKIVILEVDYHSLGIENESDYFRYPWYFKFYDLPNLDLRLYEKASLYLSSPSFFNNYILEYFNPNSYSYTLNEFGFITNDFPGIFEDLNFDRQKIVSTSKERLLNRHKESSFKTYNSNKNRLISMIRYCRQHKIQVVLLKNPVFETYYKEYDQIKNEFRLNLIDSLKLNFCVEIFDFEKSANFEITDFKNDDHLNSIGAQKLTLLVDKKIKELIFENE